MDATKRQLELIKLLAKRYFGENWRDDVDAICITSSKLGWEYECIEQMSNTEAGWLIIELEDRVKSLTDISHQSTASGATLPSSRGGVSKENK